MKCSVCPELSNYLCSCAYMFLCNNHLGGHHEKCHQPFQKLEAMSTNESKVLRQKLIGQIQALKTVKSKIQNEIKKLIIEAEHFAKSAKITIEKFEAQLYQILNLKCFYNIQKKEIEDVTLIRNRLEESDYNFTRHIKNSYQNILQGLPVIRFPYPYLPIEIIPSNDWDTEQKKKYLKKLFGWNNVIGDRIFFSNDGNISFHCKI